jgi:hypothetical protein
MTLGISTVGDAADYVVEAAFRPSVACTAARRLRRSKIMPIGAEFLVALIFSSNRSQPEGSSTQTNGQERRSRIRQPLNDVEVMLAAFRRPRARPGL